MLYLTAPLPEIQRNEQTQLTNFEGGAREAYFSAFQPASVTEKDKKRCRQKWRNNPVRPDQKSIWLGILFY